ncbi:MAG: NCS1 family nucleobase:cation symporter-1 [Bacteroidetes bacterium]|nr:NCS1 family nucleobase:cation symporter-1 [Bacteroidota bacterium]
MSEEIVELTEDLSQSPLYSADLAPVPIDKRTWNTLDLAAIWVGMAVCIPTYILASYMIKSGLSWYAALIIIGLANLIITVPMILNGHGGVKYGVPFPVIGRSSFGYNGIHIPAVVRAIVACGWFGVQTWIGGLAIYAIWNAITGNEGTLGLDFGKFLGFGLFWLLNMYFIWKGTESIKWLEKFAAPILLIMGIFLIIWGASKAGGIGEVIKHGSQLQHASAVLVENDHQLQLELNPLKDKNGTYKASEYQITTPNSTTKTSISSWIQLTSDSRHIVLSNLFPNLRSDAILAGENIQVQFRAPAGSDYHYSSIINIALIDTSESNFGSTLWGYILWLTAMVGFWATMSISIADITRYASRQKEQVVGQFLGLPGTMILYSFVGIFVTFAAVIHFEDILIGDDAPWDPVSFLAKFDNPWVVVTSQIFMIIATLSTNIAANVIAPANAFSNLLPKQISFKTGGTITGIIGIIICPWWLLDEISSILIFVSGLLGPVLGILLCDYFLIRKKTLQLPDLYKKDGIYSISGSGFNPAAMIALFVGVLIALVGYWVPALGFLYNLSWFTGFFASFVIYYFMMKSKLQTE